MMMNACYRRILTAAVICLVPEIALGQTVLWNFDAPNVLPTGWDREWNLDPLSCTGIQTCDTQHGSWHVANGELRPPSQYGPQDPDFRDIMDAYATSPRFRSVAPAIGEGYGSVTAPFYLVIRYNESQLADGGHSLSVTLLDQVNPNDSDTLFDINVQEVAAWQNLDAQADSEVDGVIHIQREIEQGRDYRLRFRAYDWTIDRGSFLGIGFDDISAANGAIAGPGVPGDYNGDLVVGAADYVVWRNSYGGPGSALLNRNPTNSGSVNDNDYTYWRSRFGKTSASSVTTTAMAAPEPTSMILTILPGMAAALIRNKRRRHKFRNN
jgi:hypothetical protein